MPRVSLARPELHFDPTDPDSGKLGVYTGDAEEDLIVRRSSAVDYYDGETG